MARLSDLVSSKKRELRKEQKIDHLASLFVTLAVCDDYLLQKKEGKISLKVFKGFYKQEFLAYNEFDLMQPLGDWLVSLPVHVWSE